MRKYTARQSFSFLITPMVGLLLCLAFVIAVLSHAVSAESDVSKKDSRILSIHDGGTTTGILTESKTLREALKKAEIRIEKNDVTEPGLDDELVAGSYEVNIFRARPVVIKDGVSTYKIMSPYHTPTQIAKQADLALKEEDIAKLSRSENILDAGAAEVLTIKRATPFTFVFYGKTSQAHTMAKNVGEMLEKKNIKLGPNDGLSVPEDTPIIAGMTVQLWRNGKQTITEEHEIDFEIEKINDVNRPVGFREVQTPGQKGKRTITFDVEMKDGQEVGRKEVNSVTTKEPVKQVEIVGSKNNYSGSLNEWLTALRTCETGNNYQRNSGNGYYGAYQFLPATWNAIAKRTGRPDLVGVMPHQAAPADQDAMVIANANATAGLSTQHPGCYKKLGLSNKPPQ